MLVWIIILVYLQYKSKSSSDAVTPCAHSNHPQSSDMVYENPCENLKLWYQLGACEAVVDLQGLYLVEDRAGEFVSGRVTTHIACSNFAVECVSIGPWSETR
jgi:hypothetical protein